MGVTQGLTQRCMTAAYHHYSWMGRRFYWIAFRTAKDQKWLIPYKQSQKFQFFKLILWLKYVSSLVTTPGQGVAIYFGQLWSSISKQSQATASRIIRPWQGLGMKCYLLLGPVTRYTHTYIHTYMYIHTYVHVHAIDNNLKCKFKKLPCVGVSIA